MEEDLFMTRPSLGITAMELFACNPFRVLGIAVDTPTADVTLTYKSCLIWRLKVTRLIMKRLMILIFCRLSPVLKGSENGLCKDRQQRIQMLRIL